MVNVQLGAITVIFLKYPPTWLGGGSIFFFFLKKSLQLNVLVRKGWRKRKRIIFPAVVSFILFRCRHFCTLNVNNMLNETHHFHIHEPIFYLVLRNLFVYTQTHTHEQTALGSSTKVFILYHFIRLTAIKWRWDVPA